MSVKHVTVLMAVRIPVVVDPDHGEDREVLAKSYEVAADAARCLGWSMLAVCPVPESGSAMISFGGCGVLAETKERS